jgi:methionyl-tRNA formyltransferase
MRFILFGDGRWAALTLDRLVRGGHLAAAVVLRRSQSDDSLTRAAAAQSVECVQPASANAPAFLDWVLDQRPDVCISIAYDQVIRQPLLTIAPHGFINAHPGKLPWYRGRSTINWAIINNESDIGVTVHVMNEGLDTGDILVQRVLPVDWHDTYGSVLARVQEVVPDAVLEAVDALATGNASRTPQPELGSYFVARGPGDEWVDWSATSLHVYNLIRALSTPGPFARTRFGIHTILLETARYEVDWPKYHSAPGAIVGRERDGLRVKTGDSTIVITSLAIEGPSGEQNVPTLSVGARFSSPLDEIHQMRTEMAELRALLKPATR